MTPWLIQRGKIRTDENRKGLDKFIAFDYMGSAEFGFGALPKSLKEIRAALKFYDQQASYFPKVGAVMIFAKSMTKALEAINDISRNAHRLKEHCDFHDWLNPDEPLNRNRKPSNNFWWDIGNNFMWWLSQPNDDQILQAIRGEK